MRKAQGSLEYLIIIAAVLAVAAVVVMFLTGALGGAAAGGNIAQCRVAAASCRSDIDNFAVAGQTCLQTCKSQCTDAAGNDLLTGAAPAYEADGYTASTPAAGAAVPAVYYCQQGNAASI